MFKLVSGFENLSSRNLESMAPSVNVRSRDDPLVRDPLLGSCSLLLFVVPAT